jgi:hypothetical protein
MLKILCKIRNIDESLAYRQRGRDGAHFKFRGGVQVPLKPAVVEHRVVLRDGTSVPAKDVSRLSGKAVVFTDAQNHLVSLRLTEVDLRATGTANHVGLEPATPAPPR